MSDWEQEPLRLRGALRTRVVSALSGLAPGRLQYWHSTGLIEAHAIPGRRGVPRLWSWSDYMKVRAAEKLSRRGLATQRIRFAIEFLDSHQPDWYLLPLHVFSGRVVIDVEDEFLVADQGRQLAIGDLVRSTLQELREEGPLGALRQFSDVVSMDPDVVAGSPVVKGTRLETDFLAALVDMGVATGDLARDYRLSERQVERAVAFSRLAA